MEIIDTSDQGSRERYFAALGHQFDHGPKLVLYGRFDFSYYRACMESSAGRGLIIMLPRSPDDLSRYLADFLCSQAERLERCGGHVNGCIVLLEERPEGAILQSDVDLVNRTSATIIETLFAEMETHRGLLESHRADLRILDLSGYPLVVPRRSVLGPDGCPVPFSA